jgi:NAD(P)-dependent dehydrogenase (short-subunit alcohol dehydrogenase family)
MGAASTASRRGGRAEMSPPLAGTLAVVTGGGRGIGRAIACALADAGCDLAICARTQPELDEAALEIHDAGGGGIDVLAVRCDVSDSDDVARFAAEVRARVRDPLLVVNNAGWVARGRIDEQPEEVWRQVLDINLVGAYLVTRAFLPAMRRLQQGRIINIASISGRQGTPSLTAYCAAKHGLIGLTRALAEEVRGDGIQVNAVCPGSVDTAMLVGSGFAPQMAPDDVARVVRFLAVEAPPALTGACLDVFG